MSWEIERTGDVAVVRMNSNPMNVINEGFFSDLEEAFSTLESAHSESPVVLTSSQRAFSAGLDLKYHFSLFTNGDEEEIWQWYKRFRGALLRVFNYEKPVVAAVNGHAIAGGLILALCCDYRVCVDSGARFGLNEITIGFPLPFGHSADHALRAWDGDRAAGHYNRFSLRTARCRRARLFR